MPTGSTAAPNGPTPARSGSPRASTGRRPSSCRIGSPGPTGGWKGVRREDLVFYELHVGTFTPEGTFEAIIPRLRDLRELGVTAVEIMPVGQFPGTRNWGYDGVLPYAAQNSYGGPHGLQRLVDACHAEGLAIFLDVVYNHFGPEGNYLGEFGPYFNDRYKTPWGAAVNYDGHGCDAVRDFVLDNVRMWLEEFHFDGLRLDAVARHLRPGRPAHPPGHQGGGRGGRRAPGLAGDRDRRERPQRPPRCSTRRERGGYGLDAQWTDDFHHAAHAFLTGERRGLLRRLRRGGATGQGLRAARSSTPGTTARSATASTGRRAEGLSGDRFVVCLQNHDQVGNRASGDRLNALLESPAEAAAGGRPAPAVAVPAAPVHGRGVRRGEPVPVLLLVRRPGAGRRRCARAGRRSSTPSPGRARCPTPRARRPSPRPG